MLTEHSIDYISFNSKTLPANFQWDTLSNSVMRNYKHMLTCSDTGARAFFGNRMTDKYHIVLSGSNIPYLPLSPQRFIETELSAGSTFSRLDLAITQYIDEDGLIVRDDLIEWLHNGLIISSHAQYGSRSMVRDTEGDTRGVLQSVETTYIGDYSKRAKKGIVRGYDKGLEMNLDQFLISRFEVEDKREKAHTTAKALADGVSIGSAFRARFDVQCERWQAMVSSPPFEHTRGEGKPRGDEGERARRWHWLMTQVAPALGRAIASDVAYNGDLTDAYKFSDEVDHFYNIHLRELQRTIRTD